MRILGIDPGLTTCGWGVVDHGKTVSSVAYGAFTQPAGEKDTASRLAVLHNNIAGLVEKFRPDCLAVEDLFFAANRKTAKNVLQARGVILLIAGQKNIGVVELTPLEVKRLLTTFGTASKHQVQRAVKLFLHLKSIPEPPDAADALAIAFVATLKKRSMRS